MGQARSLTADSRTFGDCFCDIFYRLDTLPVAQLTALSAEGTEINSSLKTEISILLIT